MSDRALSQGLVPGPCPRALSRGLVAITTPNTTSDCAAQTVGWADVEREQRERRGDLSVSLLLVKVGGHWITWVKEISLQV